MPITAPAEGSESPDWHRAILEERERRIASGEAVFSDWEEAKHDLRKRAQDQDQVGRPRRQDRG